MRKVRVSLKERSYDILIGYGVFKYCGAVLKGLNIGKDAVVITNRPLLGLYGKPLENSLKKAGLTIHPELVPDSEKAKSSKVVTSLINRISTYDRYREIFIIAFGGGVVGDVAGFVASVYKRGIPYIHIPTTLLAQVDSAIGGKVAIDLPIAKNLIGAFYQPKVVLSDIFLLKSLPERQIRNGLSEIIKYSIIKDKHLFKYLEKGYKKVLNKDKKALEFVITISSRIKAKVVEEDEFDKLGIRAILNYGHTIGHAIEAAAGYSKRFYHGEAISIGMVGAALISTRLGFMKVDEVGRIKTLIEHAGLPTKMRGLKFLKIYASLLHDKKFTHRKNRFILPLRIGSVRVVEDVPDFVIKDVIKELFQK